MSNELTIHQHGMGDLETMARAISGSKLFGVSTPEQALALCLIAQSEGRHPASAAMDYDIIQNRPAKKSKATLRDFLAAGGKVEWHTLSDERADATFSHPAGGTVRIDWDMARGAKAGLSGKDMWKKFPRQMLKARCVSEGVGTVYPMATSGMYAPEEVSDFDEPRNVTPAKTTPIAAASGKPIEGDPFADAPNVFDADDLEAWATVFEDEIDKATGPYTPAAEAFEARTGEPQWAQLDASSPGRTDELRRKVRAKIKALRDAGKVSA